MGNKNNCSPVNQNRKFLPSFSHLKGQGAEIPLFSFSSLTLHSFGDEADRIDQGDFRRGSSGYNKNP